MANEKKNAIDLADAFDTAQFSLVLDELISNGSLLNTIGADFAAAMKKYGIDGDKLKSLGMIHLEGDEVKKYSFQHNCIAVFIRELMMMDRIYRECKDHINEAVGGTFSAEGYAKAARSRDKLQVMINRSGMSPSDALAMVDKLLADIHSVLWDGYRNIVKENAAAFPFIRGDWDRGVLEYCCDEDVEYALSRMVASGNGEFKLDAEFDLYYDLAEAYRNMEKDESTDELIERVLKLQPVLYSAASSLIPLHRDPEKAKAIYQAALEARKPTKPETPKLTKDMFGCSLFGKQTAAQTGTAKPTGTAGTTNTASAPAGDNNSSGKSGKSGMGCAVGIFAALGLGNFGCAQPVAGLVFLGIAAILLVVWIIETIKIQWISSRKLYSKWDGYTYHTDDVHL